MDVWVLIADSKGVNVWCAAGAEELSTHSVVSAVKTSGINTKVHHRTLILPPLGAPGINAKNVQQQTGWSAQWGPVRMRDIPAYLDQGKQRDEKMKRVTYGWLERIDTSIGSLFPFILVGAIGIAIFLRHLLTGYLVISALAFIFFMTVCPWLPGKTGLKKIILPEMFLMGFLLITMRFRIMQHEHLTALIIIAMILLIVYASELGGISSTMPSDLDPFLARMGIGAIGNTRFAGTVRTEILNGDRKIIADRDKCIRCFCCSEVCPQGCWKIDDDKKAAFTFPQRCTACRACLVQCPSGAIKAERVQ